MNNLVFLMGGSGTRFGANVPKQYIEINEVPIFAYILNEYANLEYIDNIVVVTNQYFREYVEKWLKIINSDKNIILVNGGNNRSSSIINGLNALEEIAGNDDVVLFHDATHPYVDKEGTLKVINAINEYGGATLASFNYDTVYRQTNDNFIENVEPRANIVAGASPEGFKYGKIKEIYAQATTEELEKMTSAGAIAIANNIKMKVIECDPLNLKITYPRDMELFKELIDNYYFNDTNIKRKLTKE